MESQCFADVCDATWDFKSCKSYKCCKRDAYYAGCMNGDIIQLRLYVFVTEGGAQWVI